MLGPQQVKRKEPQDSDKLEQHFILRLPAEVAARLDADLKAGSQLKDRLSINVNQDLRHMIVRYQNEYFEGRLMDLPCIVEVVKTTDKQHYYKCGNICKLLNCVPARDHTLTVCMPAQLPPDSPDQKVNSSGVTKKIPLEKRYLFNHGLTPPLKNVRKRRFRKCIRNAEVAMIDTIAKEVRELIRADLDAVAVEHEIVWLDDKGDEITGGGSSASPYPAAAVPSPSFGLGQLGDVARSPMDAVSGGDLDRASPQLSQPNALRERTIAERDIFGEISDDSDDDDNSDL